MENHIFIVIAALAISLPAFAKGGGHSHVPVSGNGTKTARTHVGGYVKKDGTYIAPHDRSTVDRMKNNNWSTKGNTNPETGKAGTKKGDGE